MPKLEGSEDFHEYDSRVLDGIEIYWVGDGQKALPSRDATLFFETEDCQTLTATVLRKTRLIAQYFYQKLKAAGFNVDQISKNNTTYHFSVNFNKGNEQERAALVQKFENELDVIYYQLKSSPSIYNPAHAAKERLISSQLDMHNEIKAAVGGDVQLAGEIMKIVQKHLFPDKKKSEPSR